jgi:uncharacterized membrane protein YidH (DUF202 family)
MPEKESTQELAERCTEWANERTFAAWIGTGLALVAGGLASAKLLASVEPQWLVRVAGTIFVLDFRTYWEVTQDLKKEEVETTLTWFLRVLTLMLIVVAVIASVLIHV